MNNFVFGALAVVGIVIVAMALSANSAGAKIVQWGLAIAIIGVLLRNHSEFQTAWGNVTKLAIGTTGKQASS
jgi:hypothetical protein